MIFLIKKDLLIQKKSFLFLFFYGMFLLVVLNNPVFRDTLYIMELIIAVYFFLITANMEGKTTLSLKNFSKQNLHRAGEKGHGLPPSLF